MRTSGSSKPHKTTLHEFTELVRRAPRLASSTLSNHYAAHKTAAAVAEEIGVGVRTLKRWLVLLADAGYPIRESVRSPRGWRKGRLRGPRRPEEREASRARALDLIEAGKIIPFGGRRYGNGTQGTPSEQKLFKLLKHLGAVREFVVPTRMPRSSGFPTHYKIDLAFPDALIAVEIDGNSHRPAQRVADLKKSSFLESRKWRVLRFREPVDCAQAALQLERLVR